MGSTKVQVIDAAADADDAIKQEKEWKREEKQAEKREKVDIQEKIDAKIEDNKEEGKDPVGKKLSRSRSKTYISARRSVDRTNFYELDKAVKTLLKTSYSKFTGTIVADVVVKDAKLNLEITFPHSTGQSVKVAIATDALLKKIEKGDIDFDILLTTPDMMPKLAKHARTLGPKGLMPNPKNNTITDDPKARQKELESGSINIRTEKKAPLMHVVVGKTDMKETELIANIEVLIKAIGAKKIKKLVLSATMSPGIKVDLNPYQSS